MSAGFRRCRSTRFGRVTSGPWIRRRRPRSPTGTWKDPFASRCALRPPVRSVVVRPAALGIGRPWTETGLCSRSAGRVQWWLRSTAATTPCTCSPAPQSGSAAEGQPRVRCFGPGVHRPGKITLQSGETVYIAGGAVVHGSIQAHGATNVRVLGRGIIDCRDFERGQGGGAIRLSDCRDIRIEGVVMRDPDEWCCTLLDWPTPRSRTSSSSACGGTTPMASICVTVVASRSATASCDRSTTAWCSRG